MAWSRITRARALQAAVALIEEYGAEEAFARVAAGRVEGPTAFSPGSALDLERDLHVLVRIGARVLIPGDDEWPSGLDDPAVPPHCLWVRGPPHAGEALVSEAWRSGGRGARRSTERPRPVTSPSLSAIVGSPWSRGQCSASTRRPTGARSPSTARRLLSPPGSGTAAPGGAPTADRPDRRGRSGGLRGSARQRPDEAPLPQQEPHHRHCDPRHPSSRRVRSGSLSTANRAPQHHRGRSGAVSRHVHGLSRVPRVHPRPRRHPRDRCRRKARPSAARTRPRPRESGSGEDR